MPEHDQALLHRLDIHVVEVSSATWQVRQRGMAGASGSVLLGYIQRVGDVFEATDLARPLARLAASTFAGAAESIASGTVTA